MVPRVDLWCFDGSKLSIVGKSWDNASRFCYLHEGSKLDPNGDRMKAELTIKCPDMSQHLEMPIIPISRVLWMQAQRSSQDANAGSDPKERTFPFP